MSLFEFVLKFVVGGFGCLLGAIFALEDDFEVVYLRRIDLALFSVCAVFWFPWRDKLIAYWDQVYGNREVPKPGLFETELWALFGLRKSS